MRLRRGHYFEPRGFPVDFAAATECFRLFPRGAAAEPMRTGSRGTVILAAGRAAGLHADAVHLRPAVRAGAVAHRVAA
ncbi:MAG TPA: hypothetical protein VN279_14930, partial [Rhodocyclaceae bacterium]|nr:hypothetical protein [Rhodocyclaceae bacterium]